MPVDDDRDELPTPIITASTTPIKNAHAPKEFSSDFIAIVNKIKKLNYINVLFDLARANN